jgi:hypothetical protein
VDQHDDKHGQVCCKQRRSDGRKRPAALHQLSDAQLELLDQEPSVVQAEVEQEADPVSAPYATGV